MKKSVGVECNGRYISATDQCGTGFAKAKKLRASFCGLARMLTYQPVYVIPAAAIAVLSIFLASISWMAGDNSQPQEKPMKRSSVGLSSANNHSVQSSQNYFPSIARTGQSGFVMNSDMADSVATISRGSDRRRSNYSNLNSRYPLTGRLSHVVEALEESQQEHQSALEALQVQVQENQELLRILNAAKLSFEAESQLRAKAEENNLQWEQRVRNLVSQLSAAEDHMDQVSIKICQMIEDGTLTGEKVEEARHLLKDLSQH